MESVGLIDLTHPRSNGGRETSHSSALGRPSPLPTNQTSTNNMADRQQAEPSASLSEVRATLLRVADRLSSMEETPSPSKYWAIFVKYEEVMCSIKFARKCRHKVT